jgi:hypothetical protein
MACRSLISVRACSLIVRDLHQTAVNSRSGICSDIHCHKCNQIFRLFAARGITVISRLPESAPVPAAAVRLSDRNIPPTVGLLIAAPDVTSVPPYEDAEFDAMFSGEANPVVGSYRPLAHLPMELLAGPEAIPRSYYA